jgi:hypothetical protein
MKYRLENMKYHVEDWLFGCTCTGPCRHRYGKFHEWLWNTKYLMRFILWLYYDLLHINEPFEG